MCVGEPETGDGSGGQESISSSSVFTSTLAPAAVEEASKSPGWLLSKNGSSWLEDGVSVTVTHSNFTWLPSAGNCFPKVILFRKKFENDENQLSKRCGNFNVERWSVNSIAGAVLCFNKELNWATYLSTSKAKTILYLVEWGVWGLKTVWYFRRCLA